MKVLVYWMTSHYSAYRYKNDDMHDHDRAQAAKYKALLKVKVNHPNET